MKFPDPQQLLLSLFRLGKHLPPPLRRAFHWRLFRFPVLHSRQAEQLAFLETGQPFAFPSGRYLLGGWVFGETGPVVVLCHGWQGSAASWYRMVPKLVESGFRAAVFNAPGHHASPRVSSLPAFTQAVKDCRRLFAAPYVVAHSFGALAAARAAKEMKDLKGLVLLSSPENLEPLAHGFCRRLQMDPASEMEFFECLEKSLPRPIAEETALRYLSDVEVPTLLIHDRDDQVIPVTTSETLSSLENTRLLITEGLGHRLILRDPDVIDEVVSALTYNS